MWMHSRKIRYCLSIRLRTITAHHYRTSGFPTYIPSSDNFVMNEYLTLKTLPSLTSKNSAFCPQNVYIGFM